MINIKKIIQHFSNLIIEKDLVTQEFNNISKNISKIIDNYKKDFDILDEKERKYLETLFFIYMIEKIAYSEYLNEFKNDKFSFPCIQNLNYIRAKFSIINKDNTLTIEAKENIIKMNNFFSEDNSSEQKNIFVDNNIFDKEVNITLDTNTGEYRSGNDTYIILGSEYINVYSLKSKKLLFKIQDKKNTKLIRFSPNDSNIFLCSSNNSIKIYNIKDKKYELIKEIKLEEDAYIKNCLFIPNNKNNILIVDDNNIKIINLNDLNDIYGLDSNLSNNSISFSNDGKIFGFFEDNLLKFYKFENMQFNFLSSIMEDLSLFHIRNKNNKGKYNLISIKNKCIRYYYDIMEKKYENIKLFKEVKYSSYDDDLDYLFLSKNFLIIFQVSNWNQILYIEHENILLPLNSSISNKSLIKIFVSIDNLEQKHLYKYTLNCSKLKNKSNCDDLNDDDNDNDNSSNKLIQLQSYDFSYKYNIIDKAENKVKNYLKIPEIEEQLNENYKYSLPLKKSKAAEYFRDYQEKGTIYEQYINLVKIIIMDNVNTKILTKYLQFLKKNKDELTKFENVDSYEDEIKYYKMCFSKKELIDNFKFIKELDEKEEFLLLLNNISNIQITEENIDYIFQVLDKIKDNLSRFNQPVEFTNKELFIYINRASLALEILKKKEKKKIQTIKNIQTSIKIALERKLFEDENIINDESKFYRLMIIILRGQTEIEVKYNFNLLSEINYSKEEKQNLISKMDNSSFLKSKYFPGLIADPSKIEIEKIDNKFSFNNLLVSLEFKEIFEEYELYKEKQLFNYFKKKLNFERIKRFMIQILVSNCIKEAFDVLYEKKYNYPFKSIDEAEKYVNNYIDFIVLKDTKVKGVTNKFTLKTKIFLKKCKVFNPEDMSETILYNCLYSGIIIKVFLHELNHEFYNFYFYHSNCSVPLLTPRKKKRDEREGGKFFELLLFKQSIKKINLIQALYMLNRKNYNKSLSDFSEDFQSPKDNDLKIEGEFSFLNEEIIKLKNDKHNLEDYYLKTDEDQIDILNDYIIDCEIEDDVIGSY